MKVLMLSAGFGTRLRPLTENLPKVMAPINNKPCLEYHLENFRDQGIKDFAINTHHLPDLIRNYFRDGSKLGVSIRYSFEPSLLGTAGALNYFRDFFTETFAVVYADVFADFKLEPLIQVHKKNNALVTITIDSRKDLEGKGLVRKIGDLVAELIEKPSSPIQGMFINSGFYILEPGIFYNIPNGFSDFPQDILPSLVSQRKVFCAEHKGFIFDIGTPNDLEVARAFSKLKNIS